jgi:ligand-binding sensor domain-containing protein/signal transduction histidine kinase
MQFLEGHKPANGWSGRHASARNHLRHLPVGKQLRGLVVRGFVAWLFLAALCCRVSTAQSLAQSLDGYTRRLWQATDGLPEQTVQAFAQTPDGFLWIGTTGGLLRFDGARFTLFDRQNTTSLHENNIFCLMVSRDGALWIGTEGGGLARYPAGQFRSEFRSWTTREGISNDFVRTLAQDSQGTIWAGTDNGLLRLSGDRFIRVDGAPGIPALAVHSIYQERNGSLWAGGSRLLRITGGITGYQAREYTLRGEASQNRVKSILETSDGSLWVGTVSGLNRRLPGRDTFERVSGITGTVRVLRQASDGALWIGTIGQGVFRYRDGRLAQITPPALLPSNTVLNFYEDSEKNFWIGTQAGMLRLTRTPVSVIPLPQANDSDFGTIYQDRDGSLWIGSTRLFRMRSEVATPEALPGLAGVHVRNVYRDRSGALWVGTDGDGVFRIAASPSLVTRFTTREGLSNNFVRAMAQDRDGSMWIAADEGISHILTGSDRIVSYQMRDGLAYFSTRALLEDTRGDLWVGTDSGLSHLHRGAFVNDAATEALAQLKIWTIHEDADGGLWFGTRNNGLFRYRDGKVVSYSTRDGLAGNAIYQILEDAAGHFWMSGPNGISLLDRHELDAQAESSSRHLALTFYSVAEISGVVDIYGGTQSSGSITAEGDVWFPSNRGPIHILPAQPPAPPPPPLRIESVLADGSPISLAGPVRLPPGASRLEFAYAPIHLRSQDGVRFRYRLEGFDRNWTAATASRAAEYTNLSPGKYRFHVQSFEIDNPSAFSEAVIDVVQEPRFYRTWWFLTTFVLLLSLLAYFFYRSRVRQVRARFEAVLEERSRLAREMHDTVIQGCTSVSALIEAISMGGASDISGNGLMDFARSQLRTTINEARDAIWNLRQPDASADNLGEKIEGMAAQIGTEFDTPIQCSLAGAAFVVSQPVAHDLLMVAREAVLNAVLHGNPQHIEVHLGYSRRELTMSVIDDGCGFDRSQFESGFEASQSEHRNGHHFGLKGMRERIQRCGGKFQLTTAPGKGARIDVCLPRRG